MSSLFCAIDVKIGEHYKKVSTKSVCRRGNSLIRNVLASFFCPDPRHGRGPADWETGTCVITRLSAAARRRPRHHARAAGKKVWAEKKCLPAVYTENQVIKIGGPIRIKCTFRVGFNCIFAAGHDYFAWKSTASTQPRPRHGELVWCRIFRKHTFVLVSWSFSWNL